MTFRFNGMLEDAIRRGDTELADEVERRLEAWFTQPEVNGLWVPQGPGADPTEAVSLDTNGRIDGGAAFEVRTFTPAWTATTTNPTIGSGSITGRYIDFGTYVVYSVALSIAGDTTPGTGTWLFGMPNGRTISPTDQAGTGWIRDATGGSRYPFTLMPASGTTLFGVTNHDRVAVGNAAPITWATGDSLVFNVTLFVD
jgi:hypothetical protein